MLGGSSCSDVNLMTLMAIQHNSLHSTLLLCRASSTTLVQSYYYYYCAELLRLLLCRASTSTLAQSARARCPQLFLADEGLPRQIKSNWRQWTFQQCYWQQCFWREKHHKQTNIYYKFAVETFPWKTSSMVQRGVSIQGYIKSPRGEYPFLWKTPQFLEKRTPPLRLFYKKKSPSESILSKKIPFWGLFQVYLWFILCLCMT